MNNKIYIVEDLDIIAESLISLLEALDYNVVGHSFDGEDALERIPKLMPDLILMDINLGAGIDGIEVTHRLNENYNIPVVFLTATQDKDTTDRAMKENPYAFIKKGMSYLELKQTVELALNQSGQAKLQQKESKELKSQIDIYNEVFESSPLGIFYFDLTFSILDSNPASLKIFSKKSHISPPDIDSILSEDYSKPIKEACLNINFNNPDEEIFNSKLEIFILDENHNSSPCELYLTPIFDEQQKLTYICAYLWDLSDVFEETKASRNLIEELLISRKDIESQAADLVEMTASLEDTQQESNEIMKVNERILTSLALDFENSMNDLLESTSSSYQKTSSLDLIKNLCLWARIQTDRVAASLELIDLRLGINQVIEENAEKLKNKSLTIIYKPDSAVTAIVDKVLFHTMLENILSNAIKFSEKGQSIEIKAEDYDANSCMISVIDQGVGTALEPINSLLKHYVKYSCDGTDGEKGHGLGLIVSNELLKLCHGKLDILSAPSQGTNVRIILPSKN